MSELILHHYPASPFAEKIRAILGAKKLSWKSVLIPLIMPKPDVIALTGGYRRTPILQIGADIYCDTALIAGKLDELAPAPPLYPREYAATAQAAARWADSTLFQVAVALAFQPGVVEKSFAGAEAELKAFIEDRVAMRRNATVRRVPPAEAKPAFTVCLRELEAQLGDGRGYLLGSAPTIADFSCFHPLWFVRRAPGPASMLDPYRHVTGWMARIDANGHGKSSEIGSGEAIEIARRAEPAAIKAASDAGGFKPGDRVEVLPTDYGLDPVAGELIACTPDEIAVRREDARAGEVVVHLPRLQYAIRKPG